MLNQKGMASIEMIPVLFLFVLLINFSLGFFGIIHSGILNSIGARNYAFETFRNRTNLNYLRDEEGGAVTFYSQAKLRFHSIISESGDSGSTDKWVAAKRHINFTQESEVNANVNDHNEIVRQMASEGKKTSEYFTGQNATDGTSGVAPVWIMTSYGICLSSKCENE
jgi:hypothetical protein